MPNNLNPRVTELLTWHGHSGGGVHVPFQATSNPLGTVIQTPLVQRLRTLATVIASNPASRPRWVFLVGGPGNGKSETVQDFLTHLDAALDLNGALCDALRQRFTRPGVLPRKVEILPEVLGESAGLFATNVGRLIVVQDATATETALGNAAEELANDIADLFTITDNSPVPVFVACANRGLLARAMNHAFHTYGPEINALLANVIQASSLGRETLAGRRQCWPLESDPRFCCWPLDVDSLLVDQGSQPPFEQMLQSATALDHWEVAGRCEDCDSRDLCPFRKNAAWLRDSVTRSNLVTLLRRGELARGQRWNFRDAFSLVAELTIGQWSDFEDAQHPCQWVHNTSAAALPPSNDVAAAIALALHLYPHALFGNQYLADLARLFLDRFNQPGILQPATAALLNSLAVSRKEQSTKPIREVIVRDYGRLDPATVTHQDQGHVIRLVEEAFCQSVQQGTMAARQHSLADAEELLLQHFDSAEGEWDLLGRASVSATAAVCLLRKLAGMIAKRSIGTRAGYHALDELLAEYEASLRDTTRLGAVRNALQPLLGHQGFIFNLVEILGQPTAESAALITLNGPQPGIRTQPAPQATANSPGHDVPCIEIRDLDYRIALTFDFYMALRLRRDGCAGSSLPASVRAALDRVRHRYAGALCRNEDPFIEGRASINTAGAAIGIAAPGTQPGLDQG